MNRGQDDEVKFDPVSANLALSKGFGIVIGDVLCATFSEVLVFEGVEFVGDGTFDVGTDVIDVVRAVVFTVVRVLCSLCMLCMLSVTVSSGISVVTSSWERPSTSGDKRIRTVRKSIQNRWKRNDEPSGIELFPPLNQNSILVKNTLHRSPAYTRLKTRSKEVKGRLKYS